jgi:hypothetical protein
MIIQIGLIQVHLQGGQNESNTRICQVSIAYDMINYKANYPKLIMVWRFANNSFMLSLK